MPLTITRRKGSPFYYLRGTIAGHYVYESTGTRDRQQAEAFRIKRERETWERRKLGKREPASFAEAAVAYMQHGGEKRFLGKLIGYFKEMPISQIGQAEVDKAAHDLYPNCKMSSMARIVYGPMVAIFSHAINCQLEGARHRAVRIPKVPRVPVEYAMDPEIRAILEHCNMRLRALVLLLTYTGLRIGEALRLTPRDFTMRPGWANIGRTKNGQGASVPLSPEVQAAIAQIMPEGIKPVFGYGTPQGVNKALRTAAKEAGVPHYSTHKIGRHAFAARLLNAGYDIKTVKEAGRWKKLATVDESYGHLEIRHAHDAMLDVAGGVKPVAVVFGNKLAPERK